MRWNKAQSDFLFQFVDAFQATAPKSKERIEWQRSVYDAWKEHWKLDSGVKKAMQGYFRFAKGANENTASPKIKKANKFEKGKGSRYAAMPRRKSARRGYVVRKARDPSGTSTSPPASIQMATSVGVITHNEESTTLNTEITVYKKARQVPQPSPTERERSVHEPTVYKSISKDTLQLAFVLPSIHANEVNVTLSEGFLCVVVENATVKTNDGPVVTDQKTVRLEHKTMLAKGIQAEDVHAWMKRGVLTVTCPTEDKTPREIEILLPASRQRR